MGWRKYHKRKKPSRPRTLVCRNGHPKTGKNLVIRQDYRGPDWFNYQCRICLNSQIKRYQDKKKCHK